MSDYVISCCSTVDITEEQLAARNINYIPFHFEIDGVDYPDDMGKSMDFDTFYQKMQQGAMTKTSQVNVDEYENYFESFLKEGKDLIHLTLSSGISGTVNSAMIAKGELEEKYPDRKIYVIDSLCASAGYGLIMDKLADLRDQGMSIDELAEWAEAHKSEVHHWFFTSDLTYLIRGGRVSKASGAIGGLLNICPLLNVDYMGRLIARAKIRTKKKVIVATVEKMIEHAQNGTDYNGKCYISNAYVPEDAKAVADLIEEKFPNLDGKVQITSIGTTIGSHTGPGTVALFFWGDERID